VSGHPPVLDGQDPASLPAVLAALDEGRVVGIPTDTVYGLAARIDRHDAMAAIFRAKGRPAGLALPVLIGRWRHVDEVAATWPRQASQLSARFWPGALTVVVPALPTIGPHLGGDGVTVGLRRPDHTLVRRLCRKAGPLATTSANPHGQPPCTTAAEVAAAFDGADVALVLEGGTCDGLPSTVVDCTSPTPKCLRQGAIEWSWIEASLR
jgi:L-threonylcarbamoyladenylate synthase